jgi:hypothetical protein
MSIFLDPNTVFNVLFVHQFSFSFEKCSSNFSVTLFCSFQ